MAAIMFHFFHGKGHPEMPGSLSAEDLAAIIEHTEGGTPLTFDDTLLSAYEVALPVLDQYRMKAYWFVSSGVLQGIMHLETAYSLFRQIAFENFGSFVLAFFDLVPESRLNGWARDFQSSHYLEVYPFYSEEERFFRYIRDIVLEETTYHQLMGELLELKGIDIYDLSGLLWMQPVHIQRLHKQGHTIGLHSHSHRHIGKLSPIEQYVEYRTNRDYLERLLGVAPNTMSHPFNSYNRTTLGILSCLGIQSGFRANTVPGDYGPLELPREDCADVLRRILA